MSELKNLRNELWTGAFTDANKQALQAIHDEYAASDSPFKDLVCKVIEFAREDIDAGKMKHASTELNAIHELPGSVSECEEWDKDWFYKNELAVYFDKSKNVERLQLFIALLAKAQKALE